MASSAQMRFAARWDGRLREIRGLTALESWGRLLYARGPFGSEQRRLEQALIACRRARGDGARARLRATLAPYFRGTKTDFSRNNKVGWQRYYSEFNLNSPELTSSLLLKAPGPRGEKGVLYMAFEYNLMRLIAHCDMRRFLQDYLVICASSWSPTDFAIMANFAGLNEDPLFVGISHASDAKAYAVAAPVVRPLELLASDFSDPRLYAPKPHAHREIDILMVANFSRFKRHWLLFQALPRMSRKLRVVILGIATPQRSADVLRAEARAFGVRQDIEIHTNLSIEQVAAHQCNARTSLILSRREGSCVATAESLFADSPVGMMRDAHIGSMSYINDATGMLLDYRHLPRQLQSFIERSGEFRARAWAEANITAERSSARLNEIFRQHAHASGRPWTTDLAPMCWRYVPTYLRPEDAARMQPAVEAMARHHGVRLKKFVYRPAA